MDQGASGGGFASLVVAARAGEGWAWAELYRELAPPVLGYLRARGAADPEDLAGEVFLQVVRDLRRFRGGERELRAWVLAIAHHRLVDDARSRARRPGALTREEEKLAAAGPRGDAEEEAMRRLAEGEVRALLDPLPADQRAVLLLRILGGLTVREVARVLGKRPGAVKALQRRGLERVRRALDRGGVPLGALPDA